MTGWPADLDRSTICITFDVEWAHKDVIRDITQLLDEHNVVGTFFCTHDGIDVGNHERAIHPNFRRNGDVVRQLTADRREATDEEMYRKVVSRFLEFAPEAVGVRSHSLLYDSLLLPIYRELGIRYDSTYQMPLLQGLAPFWKEESIVEIPIFFNDFFELKTAATGFDINALRLGEVGLKVFDFHPNLIYTNATSLEDYRALLPVHDDVAGLRRLRGGGKGVRTMFLELLDYLAKGLSPTCVLSDVDVAWRGTRPWTLTR